ncbi:MAG: hypothetical protein J0L82_06540 [Deltaproteobacteria bacterium]|nr:hypothetical protein [Deltaproteobacteria bacterium]
MRSRFVTAAVLSILNGILISSTGSAAAGDVKDYSIHQHGMSIRAMGMGGAFTAAVDDFSAIFYNPAYLARMEESDTNLSLLHAGLDEKFPSFFGDLNSLSNSSDITQVIDFLGKNSGNHYSARLGLLNAYFARPGWALAVLPVDFSLEMRVGQSVGPQLQLIARQDSTIAYAKAWNGKLESGKLSFGATAKAIYRGYFNKSLNAVDVAFSDNVLGPEDAAEGLTVDGDFGVLYSPDVSSHPIFSNAAPTFGMTVRNILDYGFTTNLHLIDPNSGVPDKLQRRLDFGSAFDLPDWWVWRSRLAVDVRDVLHENWTFAKGLHMGAEFLWKLGAGFQGAWRAGVSQGYFTAGFTGDLAIFRLDLVTYAQEVGTSDSPKASRILMAKMSADF